MSDKDLLGKADGLMRRHSSAVGSDTSSFPVLTDLVDTPPAVDPIDSVAAGDASGAPLDDEPSEPTEELTARVMQKVDERLQAEMQRVRREVADAVAEAVREVLANRPVK